MTGHFPVFRSPATFCREATLECGGSTPLFFGVACMSAGALVQRLLNNHSNEESPPRHRGTEKTLRPCSGQARTRNANVSRILRLLGTAVDCSLARFANLGANKELFSAMCFISPASCPQGVVTRSLRNYVECGGLTPLSAAQLDATQVARGGS